MPFIIQYDEAGNIGATVDTNGAIPDHPRQLVFEEAVDTTGKKVNLLTGELEDIISE